MRSRALVAILVLAACTTAKDPSELEANIVAPGDFKAGSGVIQSVGVLPGAGSGAEPHRYRVFLLMDAGGFQSVDVDKSNFMAGQAVELTNDGRLVLVSGTSLGKALK